MRGERGIHDERRTRAGDRTPHTRAHVRSSQSGFTLIEIMVVIAIIAVTARLVSVNLGVLVPGTVLDTEATQIMGRIDYLRSEAQLQGKVYKIEFDLERHRYRIVMPPEDRLVSEQTVAESIPLEWQYLDERVRFGGFHRMSGHTARSQVSTLVIDDSGHTTDVMIYLRNKSDQLEDYVWTIRVHGLEPRTELTTNLEGVEPRLEPVNESHFL